MNNNPVSLMDYALDYARRGWAVFPCEGKRPLTSNGFKGATTDEAQIWAWWKRHPEASIGWALPSDVVVIDVDINHDSGKYGDESLTEWEREHGKLPDTVMSLTGGGGRHYIFTTDKPVGCRTGVLPGVDVKTDGGYIILPPSLHESGRRYEWEVSCDPSDTEMASLPATLYAEIVRESKSTQSQPATVPDEIPDGERNSTLFSLACSLRTKGLSSPAVLAAISEENRSRCKPPLLDKEVQQIVQSAMRYENDPPAKHKDTRPSKSSALLDLVGENSVQLFHDETDTPYAVIPVRGHKEVWPLEGKNFSRWLNRLFYTATGEQIGKEYGVPIINKQTFGNFITPPEWIGKNAWQVTLQSVIFPCKKLDVINNSTFEVFNSFAIHWHKSNPTTSYTWRTVHSIGMVTYFNKS